MRKPTLILFVAMAAVLLSVAAIAQADPGRIATEEVANAAYRDKAGTGCQLREFIELDMPSVDKRIADAAPDAGWITERIFVGGIDAAAEALGGEVVAQDAREGWLLASEAGKHRLLGVHPYHSGGKQAFVVRQIISPC